MEKILEANNLTKTYTVHETHHIDVLKQINVSIYSGEFVTIMGPSGSGKSTLLHQLSGMDQATSGDILFQQASIFHLDDKKLSSLRLHDMGFIFQDHCLLKNLSLFENIIMPAYYANNLPRKQIDHKAFKIMKQLGIYELRDRDINQVSGGQLQRASICRALMNDPMILFADEPTGALNAATAEEVLDILKQINQSGTTILMVTHDMKVAAKSERILYMFDGRLIGEKRFESDSVMLFSQETKEKILNNWLLEKNF